MSTPFRYNLIPSLCVPAFRLQTRSIAPNSCLNILRHNIICHLSKTMPFQSRTCLVTMSYFMSRSPTACCFQSVRITQFIHRIIMISCVIIAGIHKIMIYYIQIHTIHKHTAIFLQSHKYLLLFYNLII